MAEVITAIRDVGPDAIGWVRGTVIGEAPIVAPLSGRACTYYKIVFEIRDGLGWKRLAYEARGQSFELDDGTGIALVDPGDANVEVDYDREQTLLPDQRVLQPVAELARRFKLPDEPVMIREGVLEVGEVVAAHGRLVVELDPDPSRGRSRVRVVGRGRERVFVSERSVDSW